MDFVAENPTIFIDFMNDNGPRNPRFESDIDTTITYARQDDFRCGEEDEDEVRCNHIRTGYFAWGGQYTIEFGAESSVCSCEPDQYSLEMGWYAEDFLDEIC